MYSLIEVHDLQFSRVEKLVAVIMTFLQGDGYCDNFPLTFL